MDESARPDRVYIVILNWNGWRDTIECLESVLRLEGQAFSVVVCDNASSDGSMDHIRAWAQGGVAAHDTPFLPGGSVVKPLSPLRLTRAQAEAADGPKAPFLLIDNGANLGFAGGCNVGIRHALNQPDCGYVWLLNNDCVVPAHALAAMTRLCVDRPRIGLCGSQVRYYDKPETVQTFGGVLNAWFCTTHSIDCGSAGSSIETEPPRIDYVPGASMLATRPFLEQVGPMCEDYFLYFEEIDWAERGKGRFELAVCPQSVIYHRGAASIGSPGEGGERGVRSEYYLLRGRIMFARKFYRWRLPVVYLGLLASVLTRVRRRQWMRVRVALCVLAGLRPSLIPPPPP